MRNEIKIRFDEPIYSIDEEKGIVDCVLKYEILYPEVLEFVGFNGKPLFYTTATAKLRDGDTWDVNIGKKVSLAKAEQKVYDKVKRRCIKTMRRCFKIMQICNNFGHKSDFVIDHNDKYLEQWK